MSLARRLTAGVAAAVLAGTTALFAVPTASADTDPVPSPTTGRTAVTTQPGIAAALLRAGVLPYTVSPGRTDGASLRPLALTYSFPITGVSNGLTGEITHSGGVAFVKLGSFTKRIVVKDFTIDLDGFSEPAVGQDYSTPVLTGTVFDGRGGVPDGIRVALFDIDLSGAAIDPADVQVTGANLTLTDVAAGALNAELGTSVFSGGLNVFSARANA
ncbi:MAG: hypothetical protein R2737_15770 [Candidatus Nanopelagicales bacterium]